MVFAIGSNEQHKPCLPIPTDTILRDKIAYQVAKELVCVKWSNNKYWLFRTPHELSRNHNNEKRTLHEVVRDYIDSLVRHEFKSIFVIPANGGNFGALAEISNEIKK